MKPVLLIIFNRPALTKRVFDAIRKTRPSRLYVAADGPRVGNAEDKTRCKEAREIVAQIDWNCQLHTRFSDTNIGCAKNASSAIDWFFQNVEEGIILEDDCLPDDSFFRFCRELLDYYRQNEKIMHISGNNFQPGKKVTSCSYYFSIYTLSWGWATWRRAWKYYDFNISKYPEFIAAGKLDKLVKEDERKYWISNFKKTFHNPLFFNTWDYQWLFSVWNAGGVSILPAKNLICNIGFDNAATHITNFRDRLANLPTGKMEFPLHHPSSVIVNKKADRYTFLNAFNGADTLRKKVELWKHRLM